MTNISTDHGVESITNHKKERISVTFRHMRQGGEPKIQQNPYTLVDHPMESVAKVAGEPYVCRVKFRKIGS